MLDLVSRTNLGDYMKMHSDLGKMYRRNYMVKSQLRSLEEKSKALNSKIDGETKIDEWAESYITRADAQIDDVSDYMNYRNLGQLAHVRRPAPSTKALPAPKLPIYGQQRQPAPPPSKPAADRDRDGVPDKDDKFPDDPNEWADVDNDGVGDNNDLFGAISDKYPIVTLGNTLGFVGTAALAGVVYGIVTYNPNSTRTGSTLVQVLSGRARAALGPTILFSSLALAAQGLMGAGQKTGWY